MDRINAKVFLEIAKLGSYSKASEKLGYTKAGISYIVNNMEETFGFHLFQREYGGVKLTPEGESILPYMINLAETEKTVMEQAGRIKGLETGSIRLISFNSVIVCWLPDILKSFTQKYPGIKIELSSCEGPAEGIRRIKDSEADCGFLATNTAEGIDLFHIKDEPDMAVVSLDHPMAKRDVFPIAEAGNYPFIGYSEDEAPYFYRFIREQGIELDQAMIVDNDYGNLAMVSCNMGFGIYPKMIAENSRFPLKAIPLDKTTYTPISFGIRSYEKGSLAARAFVDHILGMDL